MDENINEHVCSVTLIVLGEDLETDIVTTTLGWQPEQSWQRGENHRFVRPDGTVRVFDRIHERGGWKYFGSHTTLELQTQVEEWLERLLPKRLELRSLLDRGWQIELDCFAATSEALDLPPQTLGTLAELGVGLSFTFAAGCKSD